MKEFTHDPSEYVRGLQQLLISDKKRIAFLFGAGSSLAKKNKDSIQVPAIGKMTKDIGDKLSETVEYKNALAEISVEIESQKLNYNIETLLSNIEQKIKIIGNGKLNALNKCQLSELLEKIKKQVREMISVHEHVLKNDNIKNLIHVDFAEWIKRSNRTHPIEIFTTNYDYLFELGLEENNIPYYDGFTGSYRPFFNSESVDDLKFIPNQTKLWKIHGSLGWHLNETTKQVWRKDSDDDDILIYPSTLKYDESKKQPYMALMDRLSNFLKEPDTVLIICGYSFGDEHINDRIISALNTNTTAHVLALYYDIEWIDKKNKKYTLTEESVPAKLARKNGKLSIFACNNAIIGGQCGKWKLKRNPDKDNAINVDIYFDSDGSFDPDAPINNGVEKKGEEIWTGEGELMLPDFAKFVNFLQSMIIENDLFVDKTK